MRLVFAMSYVPKNVTMPLSRVVSAKEDKRENSVRFIRLLMNGFGSAGGSMLVLLFIIIHLGICLVADVVKVVVETVKGESERSH